jgi:hypothetical protein
MAFSSHSHPVSTGCQDWSKRVITVSTVSLVAQRRKPLKRLRIYHSRYATRLKPGVNEKAVS